MSLTKDYYTAAELAARQQRELRTEPAAVRPTATADPRPAGRTHRSRRLQTLVDQASGRLLVGAWASNFVHG